ncbi:hypothetical protein O1611_g1660 [Lasiodiplodia mahajangana]|uniref:Uncharacterized protein n=1 Tax=Lasiodiplodia mahajangana TaxID=1108764 RepID=A0ACC2JX00_9PEZI|nr:hypothetical protein O1611_g1660 [Lasiodiplodia mahajangana]
MLARAAAGMGPRLAILKDAMVERLKARTIGLQPYGEELRSLDIRDEGDTYYLDDSDISVVSITTGGKYDALPYVLVA